MNQWRTSCVTGAAAFAALLFGSGFEALAQRSVGGTVDNLNPGGIRAIDDIGKALPGARRGDFPQPPPIVAPTLAPRTLSLRARPPGPLPLTAAPRQAALVPALPAQARNVINRVPPLAAPQRSATAPRSVLPARVDPSALAAAGRGQTRRVVASAATPRMPPISGGIGIAAATQTAAQRFVREASGGIDDLPFDALSLPARQAKLFAKRPAEFLPDPPMKASTLTKVVNRGSLGFIVTTAIVQISTGASFPIQGALDSRAAAELRRRLVIHNTGLGRIVVSTIGADGQPSVLGFVEPGSSRTFSAARSGEISFSSSDGRPLNPRRMILDEDVDLRL
ncbi:hypothetical protein MCEMSEM23_01972 [Rhabdaerophilaceae bacterium]